mgnify:CR=1 FL=1
MFEILVSTRFEAWADSLANEQVEALISARIERMTRGHFGDVKSVGSGVMEARIHFGPGFRLYYFIRGRKLLVILAGGEKSSQRRDIEQAIKIKIEIERTLDDN